MGNVVLSKAELSVLWPSIESLPRNQAHHITRLRRVYRDRPDREQHIKAAQRNLAQKRALRDKAMRELSIPWPPWSSYGLPAS